MDRTSPPGSPSAPAAAQDPQRFVFGEFVLDAARASLRRGDAEIALRPKSFDLLRLLVGRAGLLMSKDELMAALWPDVVVTEDSLTRCVFEVRSALGEHGAAAIRNVPKRGYLFAWPVEAASSPASAPAAAWSSLPTARTHFIGREALLDQAEALLADARLLTLTGLGGSGKTRLALRLAQGRRAQFADGVAFVDLAPLHDGTRVAEAVADAMQIREEADVPIAERLARQLGARRVLLVLDNCEHLIDAVAAFADALLARCAGLAIVATSRERLRVAGEQTLAVPPLALPAGDDVEAVRACESARLFVDRAALALPGFAVDAGNAAAIAGLCRRLDGLPLAIELAAARVRMLSVAEIAARLSDRFTLLAGGSGALPRHETLRATLQWSEDSLAAPERRLLHALTVFVGGCAFDAVVAVCGHGGDDATTLEHLTRLHDKSLLIVDRELDGSVRFRMLETVREHARRGLDVGGEADAVRDRHRDWCIVLAETAAVQMQGPQQGAAMRRLRAEQENLLAAQDHCDANAAGVEAGLALAALLPRYWLNTAQLDQGLRFASRSLARWQTAGGSSDAGAGRWHSRAWIALGTVAFRMGRYPLALDAADRSLALARASDDAVQVATSLSLRGKSLHANGELDAALASCEEGCAILAGLGRTTRLSAMLNNRADVLRSMGRSAEAERCYDEAIAITREVGYPGGTLTSLCNLVRLLVAAERFERTRALLLESLDLGVATGLEGLAVDVLDASAGLAVALGDDLVAAYLAGAARARLDTGLMQREPLDRAFIAPRLDTARRRLGAEAYDRAEAEGHALGHAAALVELRVWLQPAAADAAPGG